MKRAIIAGAACVLVAAGCRTAEDVPAPVVQTGCLTGSEGQFVLTDLDPAGAEGQPTGTTETYQLLGNDEELRQHVGTQVRVTGEAVPPAVVETRQSTPPAPPEPTATTGEGEPRPQVSTQSQTRVEVSRLRVSSVTPTGDECGERVD